MFAIDFLNCCLPGYIGPGAGLSLMGALIGLVSVLFSVLFFTLFWPVRALIRKMKRTSASAETHRQDESTASLPKA